jgi:signal peptidase I
MSQISPEIEPDAFDTPAPRGLPQDDERFSVPEVQMGRRPFARELLETILLTVAIFIGVRFVVQNFVVEGTSMEPTLHTNQMLLVNKAAYFQWDTNYVFGAPQRGDIVVFHAPNENPPRDFIKRVIALPGETVDVRAGDGVYIKPAGGQTFVKLDEPYIKDVPQYNWPIPIGDPNVDPNTRGSGILPGELFVLGDNRNNSDDSHEFGPIKMDSVVGRAWFTYWPREDFGPLSHPVYANLK